MGRRWIGWSRSPKSSIRDDPSRLTGMAGTNQGRRRCRKVCPSSAAAAAISTKHALRHGQIDGLLGAAFMSYHLIHFTREALRGAQNASYYSARKSTAAMAVVKPPQGEQVAA